MCNNCDCENSEQCSIIGHQPLSACCSICVEWDEAHTCEHYQSIVAECTEAKIVQLIPNKIVKKVKGRIEEISLEHFP